MSSKHLCKRIRMSQSSLIAFKSGFKNMSSFIGKCSKLSYKSGVFIPKVKIFAYLHV